MKLMPGITIKKLLMTLFVDGDAMFNVKHRQDYLYSHYFCPIDLNKYNIVKRYDKECLVLHQNKYYHINWNCNISDIIINSKRHALGTLKGIVLC